MTWAGVDRVVSARQSEVLLDCLLVRDLSETSLPCCSRAIAATVQISGPTTENRTHTL